MRMMDEHFVHSYFWYLSSISTLFVWNSVLSLTGYWTDKMPEAVIGYFGFYFMLGAMLSFLSYKVLNNMIEFHVQI